MGVKQKLSRAGEVLEEVLDGLKREKKTKNRFFFVVVLFLLND